LARAAIGEVLNLRVPFAFNRLKTVILTSLAFLILSAMVLIHVVTAKITERDLINARIQSGRLLIESISILVSHRPVGSSANREKNKTRGAEFQKNVISLLRAGEFSGIKIKNNRGQTVFSHGEWGDFQLNGKRKRLDPGSTPRVAFLGRTWGLFWQAPERVLLTTPIWADEHFTGSVTVFSDLRPLYVKIRESEPVILAYIAMNALILILFGIYLLSKTVVKPINRLVALTEKFDGDIPVVHKEESPNNEIGRLSQSLSHMLRQLDANERKLKENISSLENANREIQKAQDEMVESEKMASVGRLATGVAHEIGNPLGIILGYIELLERGDLTDSERKDFLNRMESELSRIHRIIRDLLDFSRPSPAEQHDTDAHAILEEVLSVLGPQPGFETVKIERFLKAETVMVRMGQDPLKQVFLNIIINAADAMADDPCRADKPIKSQLTLESFNKNGFLVMRFSDTGCGVPRDDLKRIFDPFFTTKAPGKGTGLGLAICYKIMDRAGGRIRMESDPGRGSTMTLEMPLADTKRQ
jgi:two-component system NtrC family sensor kinase